MPTGEVVHLKFDTATGLPWSITYPAVHVSGPEMEVQDTFSDYRDVNGIKVPFRIVIRQGGEKFADVTLKDVKFNSGLNLADLEQKPAPGAK